MSEPFDLDEYRRERLVDRERTCDYWRTECGRAYQLLAVSLRVAVSGTDVTERALLELIAELLGTDLARPAHVEQRARREARRVATENTIRVLRETA